MRTGNKLFAAGYFCDYHKTAGDVPIVLPVVMRRVRVHLDILLTAISPLTGEAHVEAVDRVERGVLALGGVMNLHDVTSAIGTYGAPPRQGGEKGE